MIINGDEEEITFSFSEFLDIVNEGFIAERLLLAIEAQIGYRIKPPFKKAGSNVNTTKKGLFLGKETNEELLKRTVREKDAIIASNNIYNQLYWISNVEASYKQWCTPELFDYFELDVKQAFEELKAAAYPILVSYNEAIYESENGESYRVPYITFLDENKADGTTTVGNGKNVMARTYYMNNKREVNFLAGEIIEKHNLSKFKEKQEWYDYIRKRKRELSKKKNASRISGIFYNIKTGEATCFINEQVYSENYVENQRFLTKKNPDWYKVRRGIDREFDNVGGYEKQFIIEKGQEALDELSRSVMDLSNLRRTIDGRIAKNYDREF